MQYEDSLDALLRKKNESEEKIAALESKLAEAENVDVTASQQPLGGVESGISISFDFGKTWIRAFGYQGFENLLEKAKDSKNISRALKNENQSLRIVQYQINWYEYRLNRRQNQVSILSSQILAQSGALDDSGDSLEVLKTRQQVLDAEVRTLNEIIARTRADLSLANERLNNCR